MNEIILIPVIIGIVAALKMAGLPSRYAPILSLLLGMSLAYFLSPIPNIENVVNGIIAGLSASGLYSGAKATISAK